MVLDTISRKKVRGIPTWMIHIMDINLLDEIAGVDPGTYLKEPEQTYLKAQKNIGVNFIDQFIPENPLSMTGEGFGSSTQRGATTGIERIVLDGITIDSPESVVEHLERVIFPQMCRAIEEFDQDRKVREILENERMIQEKFGSSILKVPYGFISFPVFRYGLYGYENYFMAYALYPEIIEKDFSLQADYAQVHNRAAARAITEGKMPLLYRLDHDMADSRGTLVSVKSLEKIWLPHFERSIREVAKIPGMNLIWHCDGNLMEMIPMLLDTGIKGFQGFQYEAGMDYKKICRMKARDGDSLIIIAGVSVTTTLPFGTPDAVRREMKWLVEEGPEAGLFLGASSSITPNTRRENILTLIEGLRYYREHGRA